MTEKITENAKAILLLCGHFGPEGTTGYEPLSVRDYDALALWLQRKNWWPADLLDEAKSASLDDPFLPVEPQRIKALLGRGAAMALAVERWTNRGLWILCRSDRDYPSRLKQHLKGNAPPILFGAGNQDLLSLGGMAVVGSRNIDAAAEQFTQRIGRTAAQCGIQVISGAARGVDVTAMHAAFEAGGGVVGVLADSLFRASVSGTYREGLRDGQLALVSVHNPEAGFSIGTAMGRNKYIYALADFAVVVSADYKTGGTWAGAQEELGRDSRRPVFVRTGPNTPEGNSELLKLGGKPFPENAVESDLRSALGESINVAQAASCLKDSSQPVLPGESRAGLPEPNAKPEAASSGVLMNASPISTGPLNNYETVKPLILTALNEPRNLKELAQMLQLPKGQIEDWVKLLLREGAIEKRTIKRSRKLVRCQPGEHLNL